MDGALSLSEIDELTVRQVGEAIRRARESRGVTQEALAVCIAMDRKTVNRIERGLHAARITTLVRISTALDVPLVMMLSER